MISLPEAGGMRKKFLGYWHIWKRKLKETKHAREAVYTRKRCRVGHPYDPLAMGRARLHEL